MDERLLLKEKDYEQAAIKRRIEFKHSFNDPLINPTKKKKTVKRDFLVAKPAEDSGLHNNVLTKTAKPKTQLAEPSAQQLDTKVEATPWSVILQFFLKAYDYQKQPLDTPIANPFGSQGLRSEDQAKGTSPSLKTGEKDQRTHISRSTYISILKKMRQQLSDKWAANDKVGSLRIAIQSCKLLHDTSNAKFHALKFAYVMKIVEEFGINVFKRIKALSFPNVPPQRLSEIAIPDLQGANIPESAQEICRNWLLKISSIRELIPRTIIQTTLLRLYFFLDNGSKAKKVLDRLARSNRCFGEHINCIFFCTFLIRMGTEVMPHDKDYILDILDDVFFYIKQGKTKFSRQDISYDEFFTILEPFFISSFESLAENLQKDKFRRFCQILPQNPHPVILTNFILSFSPSLLVAYSIEIVKMLQKLYRENKYAIYKILLERLSQIAFPQSGQLIILAWTDICEVTDLAVLLDLLGPFSNLIFKNLPRYEKNKFYSLIFDSFNNAFDNLRCLSPAVVSSFQKFLTDMLAKTEDIRDVLTLEPFLQVVAYLPNNTRQELSMSISEAFLNRDDARITDPVVIHLILSLMRNIEGPKVHKIVIRFLQKIDFAKDIDQSLNFYCEMRAAFGHIEQVTISLIYKAVGLTVTARRLSKGRITNKLVSFLQATMAFCYITVPLVENSRLRLKIYLYLSEVALANNLISQSTELIKTCITQLAEEEAESDQEIFQIFSRIISFMIVIPDDPQQEFLFLFNGLFQAFCIAKFRTNFEYILRFQFQTQCIVYLSCQAQEKLPFHIEGVTSNDALFKSIDFRKALIEKIYEIVALLEGNLAKILEVGGAELEAYSLVHLTQCSMTLLNIFEDTARMKKLIKAILRVIETLKERVFANKQKALQGLYVTCLAGLKKKLAQNGYRDI